MDLRRKYYPYPVLSKYSDDYMTSTFQVDLKVEREGHDITLHFNALLDNEELNYLIEEGKALITYHLECSSTGFRKALTTRNMQFSHIISNKNLNQRLQVCPFIIAVQDIEDYVNKDFHQDYVGIKFPIETGCIMAFDDTFNIDIEKNIDELANTSSVFSIVKNLEDSAKGMVLDIYKNKIVIKIPERTFNELEMLNKTITLQSTINSLIIVPALIFVLQELKACPQDERYEFSSYGWYRAIKKALAKHFNCDLESESFSNIDHFRVAQELIGSPFEDAVESLFYDYKNISEDEEDEE